MLTTKEAAELLGITPRRVQELIKNGALEARKAVSYTHLTLPTTSRV